MQRTIKALLATLLLLSTLSLARAPTGIRESSFESVEKGMILSTWIVDDVEWILETFFLKNFPSEGVDLDDPSTAYPSAEQACPDGWRVARADDWQKLFRKFPSKRVCECSESGETEITDERVCRNEQRRRRQQEQECETCTYTCNYSQAHDLKPLLFNRFIMPNEPYQIDDYSSFSVNDQGLVSHWYDYWNGRSIFKFKCVKNRR